MEIPSWESLSLSLSLSVSVRIDGLFTVYSAITQT